MTYISLNNQNSMCNKNIFMQNSNNTVLSNNMRLVWLQHIYWTRMLIISITEKLDDQNDVTGQLLQNPNNISKVFSDYYPINFIRKTEQLLTEHLQIGAKIITALRDGRTEDAEALNKDWYINADKIADSFSLINPYFNNVELRRMLYNHLDLTKDEVAKRLSKDYKGDITAFNNVETEILQMADYFTEGIIKQFCL